MLFFTDISVISIIVIIVVIAVVFYRFFVILVSKATVRLLAPCGLEIGPKVVVVVLRVSAACHKRHHPQRRAPEQRKAQ